MYFTKRVIYSYISVCSVIDAAPSFYFLDGKTWLSLISFSLSADKSMSQLCETGLHLPDPGSLSES
jgi:hypothetical protein